jgi:hypothetical protein
VLGCSFWVFAALLLLSCKPCLLSCCTYCPYDVKFVVPVINVCLACFVPDIVICSLSCFDGSSMPPRHLPPAWVTPHWVPGPPPNQSRFKRKSRSFVSLCLVSVCFESALPYWNLCLCTLGDGWYPFLGAHISRFNRKKMRLALDLRRSHFKGVPFTHAVPFVVTEFSCSHGYLFGCVVLA